MTKFTTATIFLASSILLGGCATKYVLVGGDRVMHYPAGTEVPGMSAKDNVGGVYVLTDDEMNAVVNP